MKTHVRSLPTTYRTYVKCLALLLLACCSLGIALPAYAQQVDIPGPVGSGAFGTAVAVLPNGNIVVTDPNYSNATSNVGAVYLSSPTGTGKLISTLTGSTANDHVGNGGITVLTNGNFVISSLNWNNGATASAGAVTWVNGRTGLSGTVSAANSLVGTTANDQVGYNYVAALTNGNYVVDSSLWNNGAATQVGAVTWANGNTGLSGVVSVSNSLVGTAANDQVGAFGVTELTNGNYVVDSYLWNNGAGAATWANGSTGLSGPVSASNSLVGSTANDLVGAGFVAPLSNGNYVVASPNWANGAVTMAGAATWANGSTGLVGPVSVANSLVGTTANDQVGYNYVAALTNGNYVVDSSLWNNGAATQVGAVTWANGNTGLSGVVSVSNSLVGSATNDQVGHNRVAVLTNGNYVVASRKWANGAATMAGAVTWANGSIGLSGAVSAANSLVGTTTNDQVGYNFVHPLTNGNYVVASPNWNNGAVTMAGAATWANGSTGLTGAVSVTNSLVGTTANDQVGGNLGNIPSGVITLSNGNYVVPSPNWNNGAATVAGAVTWGNGSTGVSGPVSASNSLVGSTANDQVGGDNSSNGCCGNGGGAALSNGNYVVASPYWTNGTTAAAGAVTWANGSTGLIGALSAANSLVGTTANDQVGLGFQGSDYGDVTALSNGDYVVGSPNWNNGATAGAGAISLGRGSGGTLGPILATNSVRGTTAGGGASMVFAYDATRDQLVVGQPASNIISLFKADLIFANGFE